MWLWNATALQLMLYLLYSTLFILQLIYIFYPYPYRGRLLLRTPGPVPLGLAYVLLVETNPFPNLSLIYRTMLFEYPLVLSRFCLTSNCRNTIDTIRHIAIKNCPFRFAFSHPPRCGKLLRQKKKQKQLYMKFVCKFFLNFQILASQTNPFR